MNIFFQSRCARSRLARGARANGRPVSSRFRNNNAGSFLSGSFSLRPQTLFCIRDWYKSERPVPLRPYTPLLRIGPISFGTVPSIAQHQLQGVTYPTLILKHRQQVKVGITNEMKRSREYSVRCISLSHSRLKGRIFRIRVWIGRARAIF